MLARLFSTGSTESADPLGDVARAEHFVRELPKNDPVVAQKRVCQALADFCARDKLDKARLRALLTLDVQARPLRDGFLVNFLPGNPQPRSVEALCWQAAFELSRALGSAHAHALRSMRESLPTNGREFLPLVLLRFFEHRQMELLLRPFADERSMRFLWKELHETYKFARSSGVLPQSFPVSRPLDSQQTETTLEREYIAVLLQDLVNGGQVPPQEAFWASRRLLRWSQPMTLEQEGVGAGRYRFGIDLDGDGGPTRVSEQVADSWRYFDTAPALKAIEQELASLREESRVDKDPVLRHGRRVRLLRKLNEILKPERAMFTRRGERTPVALTVEVVVGMTQIVRALRSKPDDRPIVPRFAKGNGQDEMFTTMGGFTEIQTGAFPASGDGIRSRASGDFDAPHPPLTMVDRSESGCRLHGMTHPLNPIVPGMLVAFREASAASWTIGVVRRARKRLGGKRVELGVEFLGRDARRVIIAPAAGDQRPDQSDAHKDDRFAAIYLPESAKCPTLPMKTLILPSRGLKADDRLSVRSRASIHTIALKEAFEEQADFMWSPFDIIDQWLTEGGKSSSGTTPAPR
jgi:hypothetical protein